ncbi:MAG: TfoX/Sxy family protein [Silvanigrellales bacterium]|jgi:hypothetical protein|nr:TfoX/Sxy family protein [Silvanigrellales bacterium]
MTFEKTLPLAPLRRRVDLLVMDWPGLVPKRMFGTDAWFVNGNIFAIIDTTPPRVGVKLTEAARFGAALKLKGAKPFAPGDEPMRHWVVLPSTQCESEDALEPWLREAYLAAALLTPKAMKNRGRAWLD